MTVSVVVVVAADATATAFPRRDLFMVHSLGYCCYGIAYLTWGNVWARAMSCIRRPAAAAAMVTVSNVDVDVRGAAGERTDAGRWFGWFGGRERLFHVAFIWRETQIFVCVSTVGASLGGKVRESTKT